MVQTVVDTEKVEKNVQMVETLKIVKTVKMGMSVIVIKTFKMLESKGEKES